MLAISACIAILRLALRPLASAIIYEMAAGPGIVLSVIPRISGQQGSSAQPAVSASGSVPLGPIRPEDFGAAGDGVADDRDAIKQAIRYASETGRTLHIPAKTYRTSSGFRILHPIHIWCESGATILTTGTVDTAQQGFKIESSLRATLDFSARISSSNDSFTINDAAALAVGQEVMLWLGTDPYDPTQEYLRMWNVVKGIDGTTVTFDVPVPEDISGTEHKVAIFTSIAQNITIDGCRFSYAGPGDFDQWIMIINARNVTLQNIYGDLVAGSINIQESEGVVVDGLYVKEAIYRTSYGGSGSTLTGWGMRGCSARNIYIDQAGKSPVYLESQSRDFRIQNLHIQMVDNGLTFNPGVTVIGNSTATLTDYYFSAPVNSSTAFPPYLEADTSRLAVENLTVYSLSDNSSYSLWPVTGTLNLNGQRYTF
jgi:polygalacturonase